MAAPDFNIGPTGPIQPISTSRALSRVTPIAPQAITNPDGSPLSRSGVTARDLLSAPDSIAVRSKTPSLALGMGLEQARGALIRNQPTDALMALDEVWEGARNTESGWYLRGGSLTLLGLPGEATRVVAQLLDKRPESIANRFLLSLTKLTSGDVSGAKQALVDATARRPNDALLMVQEALLLARSGNQGDAEKLLKNALALHPDHPAIQYGRLFMRQALRDGARVFGDPLNGLLNVLRTPRGTRALNSIDAEFGTASLNENSTLESGDVLNDSLMRIGSRLALDDPEQTVAECRSLLLGLSSGGSLASAVSPSRAFSARSVLGAIIESLHNGEFTHGDGWEAQSIDGHWQRSGVSPVHDESMSDAFRATVRQLVSAMREERTREIDAILRRLDPMVDSTKRAMLRNFAGVARESFATPNSVRAVDTESILLPALRLGLGLLPPDEVLIASRQSENRIVNGVTFASDAMRVWGASGTENRTQGIERGTVGVVTALALLLAAVLAFSASHAVLGFACVGGAAWMALRQGAAERSARRNREQDS